MATYGQDIYLADGSTCGVMGCPTHEEAVQKAVDLARASGWRPRKLYELWLPECSDDVRAEYYRQENTNG